MVIYGADIAKKYKQQVKEQVILLKKRNICPKLAVLMIGENAASKIYVAGKLRDCEECGILSKTILFPADVSQERVLHQIEELNQDVTVHGILLQLPLPSHLCAQALTNAILPQKDVDGFTAVNLGLLASGQEALRACTPAGCLEILKEIQVPLQGKHAVVIGRSNIVGRPLAMLLTNADCTVTLCHSKTKNLKKICQQADIVIAALGKAKAITADYIQEGAVVIDVGINRDEQGKLCGDVDFEDVVKKASFITPVPGGVGLMTRAMLMKNTVTAAKNIEKRLVPVKKL